MSNFRFLVIIMSYSCSKFLTSEVKVEAEVKIEVGSMQELSKFRSPFLKNYSVIAFLI